METLLILIIVVYALAMIVVYSRLWPIYVIRELVQGISVVSYLMQCPACCAGWISATLYYLTPSIPIMFNLSLIPWVLFFYGTTWMIGRFLGDID